MRHPILAYNENPIVFLSLLRSYVELNTQYWLDGITTQGRTRLTNMDTGEYVIYGSAGPHAHEEDEQEDEHLAMNIPRGMLRAKIGVNQFELVETQIDIESMGSMGKWAIVVYRKNNKLVYDTIRVSEQDQNQARLHQYQVVIDEFRSGQVESSSLLKV